MKLKFLLQISFLIVLLSAIAFGQNDLSQNKLQSLKESDVALSISLKEKEIKKGESFELKLVIQNHFSRDIFIPYNRYDDLGFGQVEIKDSGNKLVARLDETSEKQPRIESWTVRGLTPNEKFETNLQISHFFNLPVGKYAIITSFTVVDRVKKEKVAIKSNIATLTVTE